MSEEVTTEVFQHCREDNSMEEVDTSKEIAREHADGQTVVSTTTPGAPATLIAPTLRVEELRDDDEGRPSSFICTSEEEGASHNEISDGEHDHAAGASPAEAFVPPDDELKEKIIKQVEFYFSDANILKDAFLLKHVRRNKMGYVSIKLITSFKRVKSMTKDYRVTAYSLKGSDKLEVNEEGTKVRRKDPLPEYDETTPSRTVVAIGLSSENLSIESVAEMFSKCGDVVLIRIIRPGSTIPPDIKRNATKHPEIGTTVCAVIEFEKHEYAQKACKIMTDKSDWRNGMRVVMLSNKPAKKDRKQDAGTQDGKNEAGEDGKEDKKKRRRGGKKKNRLDELSKENDSSCYSSGSEADNPKSRSSSFTLSPSQDHDANHLSPTASPRSSPRGSPRQRRKVQGLKKSPLTASLSADSRHSPRSSPESTRKAFDSSGADSAPTSPWVQRRRMMAAQANQDSNPLGSSRGDGTVISVYSHKTMDMERVSRQPRGPDGTNGFYGGLGRGKPRSNTIN